ncbi:MAG: hypothetical protein NWS84_02545 [Polaribacter sp.]|jgi:hypothetical protein|nr:hypothetical protein [Polaribacter sp.]
MDDQLLASISYILPAAVTGYIAYYMFKSYLFQQNSDKKMQLLSERKKDSLPLKLQAYERMLLFCERLHPCKLVMRIQPISEKSTNYVSLLILSIEQEFEHNLVQQLYISEEAWNGILKAKNIIENKLQQIAKTTDSSIQFQQLILDEFNNNSSPSEIAIAILKNEVSKLIS